MATIETAPDIPQSVLDALNPAFMAGLLSGFVLAADRAAERADAETEALHRRAFAIVQAHATLDAIDLHRTKVRARQVASCEGQRREAVPWPEEDPSPSARVLNGWPDP